jgi:hypothetical protein
VLKDRGASGRQRITCLLAAETCLVGALLLVSLLVEATLEASPDDLPSLLAVVLCSAGAMGIHTSIQLELGLMSNTTVS